jgi:hypothetical protein
MQVLNKKMASQATTSAKLVCRHFLVGSFLFGVVQLLGSCFSITMFNVLTVRFIYGLLHMWSSPYVNSGIICD